MNARIQHIWQGLIIAIGGGFVGGILLGMAAENGLPWMFWFGVAINVASSCLFLVALIALAIVWAMDVSRGRA